MAIVLKINSVDKTDLIDWRSLKKQEHLTSQVDMLDFVIKKHANQTYKPALQDEVELFDGATKIFGGNIIELEESVQASRLESIFCICKDYSHIMDKLLVVETYTNKTINYIIDDIKTKYLPAGFTTTNVVAPNVVAYIAFNYEQPTQCFAQLAALVGYDWYVDYDKDIHFFSKGTNTAPFGLTDTNAKYFFNSLVLRKNIKNLRNVIYVRGGKFYGTAFAEKQEADGETKVFLQGFRYQNIVVKKNTVAQTVGIDNINDPASYDCLYNFQEKAVKFPDGTKPSSSDIIEVSGNPQLPVIIKRKENSSVGTWGKYEYKVIDKSLNTTGGAKERAKAEILDWGDESKDSSFITKEAGLRTGQQINIQSDIRGFNENFIITRITTELKTPTDFNYNVGITTKREFGMNEFLQKLLRDKDKEIEVDPDEILNEVEDVIESMTLAEIVTVSIEHNLQTEAMTLAEIPTVRALDYPTEFVYAPYPTPTGYKREGSYGGAVYS